MLHCSKDNIFIRLLFPRTYVGHLFTMGFWQWTLVADPCLPQFTAYLCGTVLCTKAPLIYLSPIANKFTKFPLLNKKKHKQAKSGRRDTGCPWPVKANRDKDIIEIWVVPIKKFRSGTNFKQKKRRSNGSHPKSIPDH